MLYFQDVRIDEARFSHFRKGRHPHLDVAPALLASTPRPLGPSPESAATYCEVLDWGGLSDWRLPDIKELASLSDTRQQADAAIDESAFPSTPAIWFWSSTPYTPYPDHAWFVDFDTGHANVADETYGHAVRCVR